MFHGVVDTQSTERAELAALGVDMRPLAVRPWEALKESQVANLP